MYPRDVQEISTATSLGYSSLLSAPVNNSRRANPWIRFFDVLFSAVGLVMALPIISVAALLIRMQDGGRAVFVQERIGLNGQKFRCYKFRSMIVDAEARLAEYLAANPEAQLEWETYQKLPRDPRITRLGSFLRKSSIDEIPQLYNVLRGDMSIVGPRPIVPDEIRRYGRWFSHYCAVRPGLTGLWQVSGRSITSYRRRVVMDVMFSRNISLGLYFRIIASTPGAVLRGVGSF